MTLTDMGSGYHNLKPEKNYLAYVSISLWQVQIHQTTLWRGGSDWYFLVEYWWNIQRITKCFTIANDILIVGYDADNRDQNKTPRLVMQIC